LIFQGQKSPRTPGRFKKSIEPVFGHTKHNRKIYRLNDRGRALVRTEWRLAMLTHNLTKLHRHQLSIAPG